MDRAILLMGATATGKTDLAVKLVEHFPLEIISVDSALIYRDMDIGTAKPGLDILQKAPHYLLDILPATESWSAWDFIQQASRLITLINRRGHIPLLVGGTMMYFNALEQGMHDLPMSDGKIRQVLNRQCQEQGLAWLYRNLSAIDAETAQRLKPTDRQRILRALEVYHLSGNPMSELLKKKPDKPEINFKRLILDVPERSGLHQRIERRFLHMLDSGFEREVLKLREQGGLTPNMTSMRCVGYRQMWKYLDGSYSYPEMVNKSVVATRQLAKRQLTWLRKYQQVKRVDYRSYSVDDVIQYLNLEY